MTSRIIVHVFFVFIACTMVAQEEKSFLWQESFEETRSLPKGWVAKGKVELRSTDRFKGKQALVLEKTEKTLHDEVSATSTAFPVSAGIWTVGFATKTDLQSMDNSYNGSLKLEFLDKNKQKTGEAELTALFRKNNWKPEMKDVEIPDGVAFARFIASIQKETPGKFWIDELAVFPSRTKKKEENIKRMMFSTAQIGNLLYPDDSKEIRIEVWSLQPLPEDQRVLSITVTDYWGAEQNAPLEATLQADGKRGERFSYSASADLSFVSLETGRYYQLMGSINRENDIPFTHYTSFAILPEAPANEYPAEDIPWTSRNWDNRIPEYVRLTHRLGIRICGVWGRMDADTNKLEAPQLDLIAQLGMGFLTGSTAHHIEQRGDGWEELLANDGEKLRQGVRNFIEKYGHVRPMIVNLGNEPHAKGEEVKTNVEAYRIIYQEIKKTDPTIYVVGTSIGTDDDFGKYGFGEWCDAYDFHVYEDAISVRKIISERYPAMFAKYGHAKPVWSTELGLNSQGMDRQFVAAELYRKTANFFAGGGANMSWFGLLYPDPEGKAHDSFGSAHNVFDCRYNQYAPKLDAIAYYNAVNSIAAKKYVEDKTYDKDAHAFLFRDKEENSLQIWYKDKGREDVFIPMPNVNKIRVIRIDGSLSELNANGKGITLTLTEDPVLLLYEKGENTLPDTLETPKISLTNIPESLVPGNNNEFEVLLNGIREEKISLKLPPFWKEQHHDRTSATGQAVRRYSLYFPETTMAREANIIVRIEDSIGNITGELTLRPSVKGPLSLSLLPMPAAEGKNLSVKLSVQNNSSSTQAVNWKATLDGEQELKNGVFSPVGHSSAYFTKTPSGALELNGNSSKEIILPIANTDLYKVYRMTATAQDKSGRVALHERPIAAFYGVPKTKGDITIDGELDEDDWKQAPVRTLDHIDQFYAFHRREIATVQDWKNSEDLSAEIRYLWDDDHLYVSVKVKDDVSGDILHSDGDLWKQDGLQFLVDPARTSKYKTGKYEYIVGEGTKGAQTWCTLSANGAAPAGNAPEVRIAILRKEKETGNVTYEIAFPWKRLSPFKPKTGENLGLTLIVNEDDGHGRDAFMTWFGNAHSKDIDTVGDLILTE